MKFHEKKLVNLFKTGINGKTLPFGRIWMQSEGNNQFSIISNMFDFNYDPTGSFSRNFFTMVGGGIFGNFYETKIYLPQVIFS